MEKCGGPRIDTYEDALLDAKRFAAGVKRAKTIPGVGLEIGTLFRHRFSTSWIHFFCQLIVNSGMVLPLFPKIGYREKGHK